MQGEVKALEIIGQIARVDQQLREADAAKRFVVNPKTAKHLWVWDIVTTTALLYTATFTPFEASFLQPEVGHSAWTKPWFLVNRILDVIFVMDMILQFFLAFEKQDAKGTSSWVTDKKAIRWRYLRSWFVMDFSTVLIPCCFDLYLAHGVSEAEMSADKSTAFLSKMRVLRIFRLVKLVRLIRASRVFNRWKSKINVTHASLTMMECLLTVLLSAHWYACIMALEASLHPHPAATWLGPGSYRYCEREYLERTEDEDYLTAKEAFDIADSAGTGPLAHCRETSLFTLYLASFSWATMVISGTGGTDYFPSHSSDPETVCVTILVVIGALLWTRVLAIFCEVATNGDPG